MCDFGISGYLVDSVAKTIDAGCKRKIISLEWNINSLKIFYWINNCKYSMESIVAYMAPERIDPTGAKTETN